MQRTHCTGRSRLRPLVCSSLSSSPQALGDSQWMEILPNADGNSLRSSTKIKVILRERDDDSYDPFYAQFLVVDWNNCSYTLYLCLFTTFRCVPVFEDNTCNYRPVINSSQWPDYHATLPTILARYRGRDTDRIENLSLTDNRRVDWALPSCCS